VWILGTVVVVLVAGGFAVLAVARAHGPDSGAPVRRYFDALARGDAAAALAEVADGQRYTAAGHPLLTASALASGPSRPSGLRITHTDRNTTDSSGGRTDTVRVSYQVGGVTVSQSIVAVAPRAGARGYLLRDPFIRVRISAVHGRELTVNGVALGSPVTLDTYAFPAAYTATAEGDALLLPDTRTIAAPSSATGPLVAQLSFRIAVAPGAEETARAAVIKIVDRCASNPHAGQLGDRCPFLLPFVTSLFDPVHWTVKTYPTVHLAPPVGDATAGVTGTGGVVHYEAMEWNALTGSHPRSGNLTFKLAGIATAHGSTISVTLL
jgi:hypothetical protein